MVNVSPYKLMAEGFSIKLMVSSSPGKTEADEEDKKADHFCMECVGGGSLSLSLNHLDG